MTSKELNFHFNKNRINSREKIGKVMELIEEANPNNFKEWETFYFQNMLNLEQIGNLGKEMYELIEEKSKTSLKECQNYVYETILIKTYQGYAIERDIQKHLEKITGLKLKRSSSYFDRVYFIDLGFEKIPLDLQIKPHTFQKGNYGATIKYEEVHRDYTNKYNREVFTLYYKRNRKGVSLENINDLKEKVDIYKKRG